MSLTILLAAETIDRMKAYTALDEIVNYTVQWLAPLFGLDGKNLTSPYAVHHEALYCYYFSESKTITLNSAAIQSENNVTIGHEVSHYLHEIVNQEMFSLYNFDYEHTNLCELVAQYGGYIFAGYDHPLVEANKKIILAREENTAEEITGINNPIVKQPDQRTVRSELQKTEYFNTHEGGESAAYFLARQYGDRYFSDFINADPETAKELLVRLGWYRPLFVPYEDRHKEYEYEIEEEDDQGKKQIVIITARNKISTQGSPEIELVKKALK